MGNKDPDRAKNVREPFELGVPGERWSKKLYLLIVPVAEPDYVIMVRRDELRGFKIYHKQDHIYADHLLMAAALVREFIDVYNSDPSKAKEMG